MAPEVRRGGLMTDPGLEPIPDRKHPDRQLRDWIQGGAR
jgi:hypothetical protein